MRILNFAKGIMNNNLELISYRNIIVFCIYTVAILMLSIVVFKKKMVSDNR